jgi:excisionase family DNA binding protein
MTASSGLLRDLRRKKLTPPELAALWGISPEKVLAWIRAGELRAVNVATRRNGRPRFLIDESDLAEFERARAATPVPTPRRRRRQAADYVRFKF